MVEVLVDTSFLLFLANTPSISLESVEEDVGRIDFIVLEDVVEELKALHRGRSVKKRKSAGAALQFASGWRRVRYDQDDDVDSKILEYAGLHETVVATVDRELRQRLRSAGVRVLTRRGYRLSVEGAVLLSRSRKSIS